MGSLNPVFVSRKAAARRISEIMTGFINSYVLGSGQFCTKPGMLFLPDAAFDEAPLTIKNGA